jgi:type II secretory pathway pseudopilin PulG
MNYLRSQYGGSLLEVVIAILIFAIATAGLVITIPFAMGRADYWRDQSDLATYLETNLEEFRQLDYTAIPLGDSGILVDGDFNYQIVTAYVKAGTDSNSHSTWIAPTSQSGTGLWTVYYNNIDFTGTTYPTNPFTTPLLQQINFSWGTGSPNAAIGTNTFSAIYTGYIEAQYSQTYTFYLTLDDGARLWINDQLVINSWQSNAGAEVSGTIALTAGQFYRIRIEYFENTGTATLQLRWSSALLAKQLVLLNRLYSYYSLVKMTTVTVWNNDSSISLSGRTISFNTVNPTELYGTIVMYVANIAMSKTYPSGTRWRAVATVTVRDDDGNPLSGVTVAATFSGRWAGTRTGVTNASGQVVLTSGNINNSPAGWEYVAITNLTRVGYVYDSSRNVETSDSVYGP